MSSLLRRQATYRCGFVPHLTVHAFTIEKLRASKYGTPDTLDHITKRFDETTKRLFRNKDEPQFIPFGSPLDKDLKAGIRGGQLKLTGFVAIFPR